jgi:hypothetical protein
MLVALLINNLRGDHVAIILQGHRNGIREEPAKFIGYRWPLVASSLRIMREALLPCFSQ